MAKELIEKQIKEIKELDEWFKEVEFHAPALEINGLKFTGDVPFIDMIYYVTQNEVRKYRLSDDGYKMFNIEICRKSNE